MIANPKQSARGLLYVTKLLVGAAIALVLSAAPASADPQPSDTHANPFAGLGCGCQGPASAGGSVQDQLTRGLMDGSHGLAPNAPGTR
jgi:hypothetical protein